MRARLSFLVILALLAAFVLSAADGGPDNSPPRRRMENRFLFVLETSSSMAARTNGIEQAVLGLLKSGMRGELRPGDTIGFWTYSDRLRPDFPMETWSDHTSGTIAQNLGNYLRHLRYEKRGRLEKIIPAVQQVLGVSERLTIIFIYDGYEPIHGTPFDRDINALQKKYAPEFRAAHDPVVTVLAARAGHVFDYTINYPGSINIPHTADPLPPPATNGVAVAAAPVPEPAASELPAPVAPKPHRHIEIIMSGRTNVAPSAVVAASNAPPPAPVNIVTPVLPAPPQPVVIATVPAQPSNISTTVPGHAQMETPAEPVPVASATPNKPNIPVRAFPPLPAPAPSPPAPASQQAALFVIAFSLLTIAIVLVIFLIRRLRGDSPPSLISQSIDRPR